MGSLGDFEKLLIIAVVLVITFTVVDVLALVKLIVQKIFRKKNKPLLNAAENSEFTSEPDVIKDPTADQKQSASSIKLFLQKLSRFVRRLPSKLGLLFQGYPLLIINYLLVLGFLLCLHFMFYPSPTVISTNPGQNGVWSDMSQPLEVDFDRPIREGVLELHLPDNLKGTWKYVKSFNNLPFVRKVQFFPDESLMPDQKLKLYVVNFDQRVIGEYPLDFYSLHLPDIVSVTPEDREKDVLAENQIDIKLDEPTGNFAQWNMKISPQVDFDITTPNSSEFILIPKGPLKQTTDYRLQIFRAAQTYNLTTNAVVDTTDLMQVHESSFTTTKAPLVESVSPEGTGVLINTPITVKFDQDMVKSEVESAFSITPTTEGTIKWLDERTFQFTPPTLVKETHYNVVFKKGIHAVKKGLTEEDLSFDFDTVGTVKVLGFNPGNGAGGVDINTTVSISFDQDVDHASAQAHFSVSPAFPGANFSWTGNTMVVKSTAALNYLTTYTIKESAGVKSINGFDSKTNFSSSFTTKSSKFLLNVGFFYQTQSAPIGGFGCNATATAMAMTYKGTSTSEYSVWAGLAHQAAPPTGDPNIAWVANYGVYWGPIVSYINSRGRTAQLHQNWNLTSALQEVQAGNPVVIWWQNGSSYPTNISYTASDGNYIPAVNGMHSVVIVGFNGTPEAPTLIYYHDPYFGPYRSRTPASFDALWANWGGLVSLPSSYRRVGVVVK